MDNLNKLQDLCGIGTSQLRADYKALPRARLNMITAGRFGSGVSESVQSLKKYFNELGLFCDWENITAGEEFFKLSNKITAAMCFSYETVTTAELARFKKLSQQIDFSEAFHDILYINDHPGLLATELSPAKKIYRCHFDISGANQKVWEFFKPHIEACDEIIFTHPSFHKELKGNISYIMPSIDPCAVKNILVPKEQALKVLKELKIPSDKPLITQISRFDRTKDPFGVIDAFRLAREIEPCRLVFAASLPPEDSGAKQMYDKLISYAAGDKDIFILALEQEDFKIAALQSISDIIVQKSFSESFGLAITEALWKARPVAASDVGGIGLQIKNDKTGLLFTDIKSCANSILDFLQNKSLARRLGRNGREYVREHFLITTELQKHLAVFRKLL